jgi:hypothetical protein
MGGPQKPGDKYNYDVATFLKLYEYNYGAYQLNLRNYDFNPAPDNFPATASTFNKSISMDLIASTSSEEFIFECKSSDKPKPLQISSSDFKKTLIEFVSLEKYRHSQSRTVFYGLITNKSLDELQIQIQDLKNNPTLLINYVKQLNEQGTPEWPKFKLEINPSQVLSVLNNLILLLIEKGTLRQAEKATEFQETFVKIVQKVEKRNPFLVPFSISTKPRLELFSNKENLEFYTKTKLGNYVRISLDILEEVKSFQKSLDHNSVMYRATAKELPSLIKSTLLKRQELSIENAARWITETINDYIGSSAEWIAIFLPGQCEVFFAEKKWSSKVPDLADPDKMCLVKYGLDGTVEVPPYVHPILLFEVRRIIDRTIINPKPSVSNFESENYEG